MRYPLFACLLLAACAASPEPSTIDGERLAPLNAELSPEQAYARGLELHDSNEYAQALQHIHSAAERGHAGAQFELGYWYLSGRVVSKDQVQAAFWIEKAAAQNQADALAYLWQLYFYGVGVEQSDARAFEWLKKGASVDADLAYRLGLFHFEGIATPVDHTAAAHWFEEAAGKGVAGACYYLGVMHLDGDGVAQDEAAAFAWFEKSARLSHAPSMLALGDCYRDGTGGKQSDYEARRWYRRAIEHGFGDVRTAAQERLREMD